jgi:pyruvate/2-oxoglutarate dehydrogenase complex dihydrolipoamide dehydrogenase (E3) component
MGPGGEDVAGRLAEAGVDVVGVDRELVGGECPYWGCVPSKMMIRAAHLLAEARRVPGMVGDATVRPDWTPVAQRIRDEATDDWDDRVAVERFEGKGGRFVRGEGRMEAPGPSGRGSGERLRGAVGDRVMAARRGIVVATGTQPAIPPIPGLRRVPYWTNREAIETKELPSSLLVLGGGAVGAELAQVFARFGVDVTVVEALDRLVPGDEPEVGRLLADMFTAEGIAVHTAATVSGVRRDGARVAVDLEDGTSLAAAQLLVSAGRRADLAAAGLGAVGVDESQGWVPVDEHLRVADGVWAVGDITGKGAFTHVAMYQSPIAADILGEDHVPADYRALPRVTFTDPEIGAVGLTEAQAPRRRHPRAHRCRPGVRHCPGLDPQGRQRGAHQARRRRRSGGAGRRHGHEPRRRRGPRPAGPGRARPGPHRPAAPDDLRLPDLPPGRRRRPARPRELSPAVGFRRTARRGVHHAVSAVDPGGGQGAALLALFSDRVAVLAGRSSNFTRLCCAASRPSPCHSAR